MTNNIALTGIIWLYSDFITPQIYLFMLELIKGVVIMKIKRLERVDYQVSIITAIIVCISFFCVYIVNYKITHDDMIHSLKDRSNTIYNYVENYLDKDTFNLDFNLDMQSDAYKQMKEKLEDVRAATNVLYLYTAKVTSEGDYIYLVDGLPTSNDDFRYPGDKIEEEIIPELQLALANKTILPDQIKNTAWGSIFISYYPIHENGKVVGVLGIEFDASHQYTSFQKIRTITPLIAIVTSIIAMVIAVFLFRRISNPRFKDMANTDYLTNLHNRNAFEIDFKNLSLHKESVGIIVTDLNNLKIINDDLGHRIGDEYIKKIAYIIEKNVQNNPVYRYGGDEFIVLIRHSSSKQIKTIINAIYQEIKKQNDKKLSVSIGYAIYDPSCDWDLKDTFKRADNNMYDNKKIIKEKK